jgi:hypothetical protein
MATAEKIFTALDELEKDIPIQLWGKLPEVAGGALWQAEILETIQSVREYIGAEMEEEDLADYAMEFADLVVSSSYKYIHDQVNALNLWASNDIEQDLQNYGTENFDSLTRWEQMYLYSAYAIIFRVIVEEAFCLIEETEEVSA